MLRKHYKMAAACTAALVLFSSHSTKWPERKIASIEKGAASARRGRHVLYFRKDGFYSIYLTFDDGPSAGSALVNKFSEANKLPINVFLIGRNVDLTAKSRELFREYQDNPFVEIGNHSYTHAERHYEKYFDAPAEVLTDFNRSRDSLHLGNSLARLPGRNFFRLDSFSRDDLHNGKEAADTLAANGYQVFGWDLEWRNRKGKGIGLHTGEEMFDIVNSMLERQKTFAPDRIIILIHDAELKDPRFSEQLEDFVRIAGADGRYRFRHLSEYAF